MVEIYMKEKRQKEGGEREKKSEGKGRESGKKEK